MPQIRKKRIGKTPLLGVILLLALAALSLRSGEAAQAARAGLTLCYQVIIPSLFPFFVLSTLMVELGIARWIGQGLEGIMFPLFRLSGACASALALGFVGGYPVGAKTAVSLYQSGSCSKRETEGLLAFCNNAGPSFILGVIGAGVFSSSIVGFLLWATHVVAALMVGLIFRSYQKPSQVGKVVSRRETPASYPFSAAFTGAIRQSFLSVLNICAFVIFFTVVIRLMEIPNLLTRLGVSGGITAGLLSGVIELTQGVCALTGGSLPLRASAAAFLLGWGGISVHCQTLSVLEGSGLSPRLYLLGKLLQGLIAAGLTAAAAPLLSHPVSSFAPLEEHLTTAGGLTVTLLLSLAAAAIVCVPLLAGKGRSRCDGMPSGGPTAKK